VVAEASFPTREEADAERARREQAARELVNPFAAGPFPHGQTSLSAYALRDWMLDGGLSPPKPDAGGDAWRAWWRSKGWTAEQRAHAWAGLDKMRFSEVEEVPAGETVFLAGIADEHYFDAWFRGVEAAFRSRESAEKECARHNAKEADDRELVPCDPIVGGPFDPFGSRRPSRADCCDFEWRPLLRAEPHGIPYHEAAPLEVVGRPRGTVHVVVRNILLHNRRWFTRGPMEGPDCVVFVRGFASKEAAAKYRKEQEAAAWEVLRPGQLPCTVPEGFLDAVKKLRIPPPGTLEELPTDSDDDEELQGKLLDWWDSLGEQGTPEIQARVWKLLDWQSQAQFTSFFDVLTVPLGD
jgi:hypothetical protein